jgi:hypothetical protein
MLINPKEIRENYGDDYHFNSWENVEGWRELILEGRYRVTNGLEHEWSLISDDEDSPSKNQRKPRDTFVANTNNPVEVLSTYLDIGTYPPPEVLLAISDCFTLYFQFHGEIELEEAFFGKPKRRGGNYAARRGKKMLYGTFMTMLSINEEYGEKFYGAELSQHQVAEDLFKRFNLKGQDIDTFLRGFRRLKSGLDDSSKENELDK